jgi:DNA invertase Pin-like site-specific DNA recombinase
VPVGYTRVSTDDQNLDLQKEKHAVAQIRKMMGISKPTLYKYIEVNRKSRET